MQYTVGHDLPPLPGGNGLRQDRASSSSTTAREVGLSLRQPWGSTNARVQLRAVPDRAVEVLARALRRRRSSASFKGFTFDLFGEFSRTRDQIYLPRGEASTEEILLRQRQLLTGYQYFFNFGISYSFGSIFNNIVNPRFGGAGFNF